MMLLSLGCQEQLASEQLVDRTWEIERFRVGEVIVRRADFPDSTYVRTYRVWADGVWTDLGRIRDQENVGIEGSTTPRVVDDHLIVFVGASTFIRTPQGEVLQVGPYDADGFADLQVNGHYDLRSVDFTREGSRWTIELRGRNAAVTLTSNDAGHGWRAQ